MEDPCACHGPSDQIFVSTSILGQHQGLLTLTYSQPPESWAREAEASEWPHPGLQGWGSDQPQGEGGGGWHHRAGAPAVQ